MVGWHHWLNGHEFEQALEVGDGQGSQMCCSSWGPRVRHNWVTELNWTEESEKTHEFQIRYKQCWYLLRPEAPNEKQWCSCQEELGDKGPRGGRSVYQC